MSKVMKEFPVIDDLERWQEPGLEKFTNQHEKAIFEMRKWPKPLKFDTEGYIKFERLRGHDCIFNGRFECGNLRQVFKVPLEHDFDLIAKDEIVQEHLPDEIQIEIRETNAANRKKAMDAAK